MKTLYARNKDTEGLAWTEERDTYDSSAKNSKKWDTDDLRPRRPNAGS